MTGAIEPWFRRATLRPMNLKFPLALIALTLSLTACGNKGPLVLPQAPVPVPTEDAVAPAEAPAATDAETPAAADPQPTDTPPIETPPADAATPPATDPVPAPPKPPLGHG